MAINNSFGKFLFYCKKHGVDFDKTLMLGRLKLYINKTNLETYSQELGMNINPASIVKDEYSEGFFKLLGSSQPDSMDYSAYENANIIHDLNTPIPDHLKNQYSVVLDSGTLEHVFNFPVSVRNCMEALKPGGHFIAITPANNMMGHGLYQFSPELYFRIFSEENGFSTKLVLIGICDDKGEIFQWYRVTDPNKVKNRVMLCNGYPAYMLVVAQKKATTEIFKTYPYQSDYVTIWTKNKEQQPSAAAGIKTKIRKALPPGVSEFISRMIHFKKNRKTTDEYLASFNPDHFKPFSFQENIQLK